jgi:hypothetical protein
MWRIVICRRASSFWLVIGLAAISMCSQTALATECIHNMDFLHAVQESRSSEYFRVVRLKVVQPIAMQSHEPGIFEIAEYIDGKPQGDLGTKVAVEGVFRYVVHRNLVMVLATHGDRRSCRGFGVFMDPAQALSLECMNLIQ